MSETLKLFAQRAEKFFREALRHFEEGDLELSAFFAEQSAQLLLKTYLLKHTGTFPQTHNLHRLFREAAKVDATWESFYRDRVSVVDDLYQAYFTSRYLPFEFEKEAVIRMLEFLKDLRRRLGGSPS